MKMNREYIVKEGLLEAYFLGELTATEEAQVFEVLQADPELMQQYKDLEESMERLAQENAVTPPQHIKKDLLENISNTSKESSNKTIGVLTIVYKRSAAIAASFAAIFMIASLLFWSQLNETKKELEQSNLAQKKLTDSLTQINKNSIQNESLIAFFNHPKTERYLLVGNQLAPKAAVLSYVNHEQKSVLINVHHLPKLADKDYQMWADVDGEMINMGVIDPSAETLSMNYIQDAESINITIEQKGGSDHPDVSNLIGSVAL